MRKEEKWHDSIDSGKTHDKVHHIFMITKNTVQQIENRNKFP